MGLMIDASATTRGSSRCDRCVQVLFSRACLSSDGGAESLTGSCVWRDVCDRIGAVGSSFRNVLQSDGLKEMTSSDACNDRTASRASARFCAAAEKSIGRFDWRSIQLGVVVAAEGGEGHAGAATFPSVGWPRRGVEGGCREANKPRAGMASAPHMTRVRTDARAVRLAIFRRRLAMVTEAEPFPPAWLTR